MRRPFTAVIKKDGHWWIGWVEEIPGVNSQGRTREELLENLRSALGKALEMNRAVALAEAGNQYEEVSIQSPSVGSSSDILQGKQQRSGLLLALYAVLCLVIVSASAMSRLLLALYTVLALVIVSASALFVEPFLVLLIGGMACGAAICASCVAIPWARFKKRPLWPLFLGGLLCLFLNISVMMYQWPARLSYLASLPALESLASEVRAGRSLSEPKRAGLVLVKRAEIKRNGIVCLWTSLDSCGNTGFVQCDADRAESLNLFEHLRLDNHWQFIVEE